MKCLSMTLIAFVLFASLNVHATGTHPPSTPTPASTSAISQSGSLVGSLSKSAANSHSAAKSTSGAISGAQSNSSGGRSSSTSTGGAVKNSGNSRASQHQTANGGNSTAAGGDASSTNSVVDASNVSLDVQGDTYEAPRIPVNTAVATVANTTAECHYHNGGAGQGNALGLSLSIGRKDGDCERFMLAEFLYSRGATEAGDRVFCSIKSVRKALGDECLTLVRVQQVVSSAGPDRRLIERELFLRGDHLK